ncbi:phage minor capsid protein [Nonomuraea longicatena]|uniref:phage minor capsid protein n=1 Tax=Nonomuraea longicatena TaxID=83682 RepID=UPI0031DB99E6
MDDIYRKVIADAASQVLTGAGTRKEAARAALKRLFPVAPFRDKSGRHWRMSTYVQMAMRTATARAAVDGHLTVMQDAGIDLVIVSTTPWNCSKCDPWEGKILTQSGAAGTVTVEHAIEDGVQVEVEVAATVAEARLSGLFHPNCRHSTAAFLPGITKTPTKVMAPSPPKKTIEPKPDKATPEKDEVKQPEASIRSEAATGRGSDRTDQAQPSLLSHESRRLVDEVRQTLPHGRQAWLDQRLSLDRSPRRQVDALIEEYETDIAELRSKRQTKTIKQRLAEWEQSLARYRRLATLPSDQVEASDAWLFQQAPPKKDYRYKKDPNGALLPPDAYEQYLDGVLATGRSLHDDLRRALDADAEVRRLRQEIQRALVFSEEERITLREKRAELASREADIVRRLLAEIRPMGGQIKVEELHGQAAKDAGVKVVRPDWRDLLDEALPNFPADWLATMKDKTLRLGNARSGRAYYNDYNDVMALDDAIEPAYDGSFGSHSAGVLTHEMGHRMENHVPGLRELEFTYIRRRSTTDGTLEQPQAIYDYGAKEMGYPDRWANPYAGRTYERGFHPDPASESWEVFQMGLESLFGRSGRVIDREDLDEFVLGILATLHHGA